MMPGNQQYTNSYQSLIYKAVHQRISSRNATPQIHREQRPWQSMHIGSDVANQNLTNAVRKESYL